MTRADVERVLLDIGVPVEMKGFDCIADAVMMFNDEEWLYGKITVLYYTIAKRRNDTGGNVEGLIRRALHVTRENRENPELIEHYIGLKHSSNNNSLKRLYRVIKLDMQESDKELVKGGAV